ncbi:MAG: DUF87 domain-containing protein [Thermoplasmata archaeon]|nr:DUF87 domain-containing protein [Thermoplasmata archaeon]MCI4359612.1 DUF87 domain-containing protein [Thermoplasmata archaeon]
MNAPRHRTRPDRAYRFRPDGPSWDLPFLRRLAEGLSTYPAGHAILLECTEDSEPLVFPGSTDVEPAVERAAWGLPGALERFGPIPAVPPIPIGRTRFGVVYPVGLPDRRDASEYRRVDPDEPVPLEGMAAWYPNEPETALPSYGGIGAVQWHWFSTGRPRLAVRVRLRASGEGKALRGCLVQSSAPIVGRLQGGPSAVGLASLTASWRRRRAWVSGSLRGFHRGSPFELTPAAAARAVRPLRPMAPFDDRVLERHLAILGASGSGKSSFLAHLARERIRKGRPTVVLDVHGDLGPAIAAGLDATARARVVAVDAARPTEEIPGVALFSAEGAADREREAAHLVASLRHLSHDGSEVYWGNRLEQVFDVFVRLVEEERGGFADLYELLTDPMRREAARATTRRRVAARFLEELPGLLRRNPEYLQPAIARVQRVALHPKLLRLLDATERPLDVAGLLDAGGSVIFRIPSAELGPAASRFAATLLASRTYLALAATPRRRAGLRVLAVFDEAHSISPSLLSEILCEGRKFGFGAAVATQYAARLAPEALAAAEGAAGTHLVFHIPRSGASAAGRWAGLDRDAAERVLPALPPGVALVDIALSGGPRGLLHTPPSLDDGGSAWESQCQTAALEYGVRESAEWANGGRGSAEEALLLGMFGLEARGPPPTASEIVDAAARILPGIDRVELASRLPALAQRGWTEEEGGGVKLTVAGTRRLGIGLRSGAIRESDEHRALLVEGVRIFARRGEWLEIVRQGRFDTRLPDGLVRQLPARTGGLNPEELFRMASERSGRWLWRAFGGRDVHVEAEVSGAERPERIRRGLAKARQAGAAVLFLVSDARRARRLSEVLRRERVRPPEAQVWTLSRASGCDGNRQDPVHS